MQVGDTLTWPAQTELFPTGAGEVTAVTDTGDTGTLKIKITSGNSPGDNYQILKSGVAVGRVNGTPVTSNRAQFVEVVNRFNAVGWTEPLHLLIYGGLEADGSVSREDLQTEWELFLADLTALGIIDSDTRVAIMGSYHEPLYEIGSRDFNRSQPDQYWLAQIDSRCTFV